MSAPLRRFLGVDESADAHTLLGLTEDNPMPTQIDAALRRQLARVHRHPDGQSADGKAVRLMLRQAAEQLKQQAVAERAQAGKPADGAAPSTAPAAARSARSPGRPRYTPRSAFARRLTEFDRAVLAVLVGCGGWNAQSRSRLVALASVYGVSVQGLMRVVRGLTEYARHGGPPIAVADITSGAARMDAPMPGPARPSVDATSELVTRLLPEFKEDSLGSTVKITALIVLVFLISLIAFVRLLLPGQAPGAAPTATAPTESLRDAPPEGPEEIEPTLPTEAVSNRASGPQLASFTQRPTFLKSGVPVEVTTAADEAVSLPQHFDDMARQLTVAEDEPSKAVLQNWTVSINTMASGWILSDDATRSATTEGMLECLYAASSHPSVSDRLLAELIPPSGRLAEPLDIVRGAWKAGMLGHISGANLPPSVTERAAELLNVAGGEADARPDSFDAAALAWLKSAVPPILDRTNYEDAAFEYWELWMSAVRNAVDPAANRTRRITFEQTLMDALHALAAQPAELSVDSRATAVIGRLMDVLDFHDSPVVRQRILALFDDDAISAQDLWIITSMAIRFEDAPWLSRELVVPRDADQPHRRRMADKWADAWPQPTLAREAERAAGGRGLSVDADLYARWFELLEALSEPLEQPSDVTRMQRLVHISTLNEAAAAMLQQDVATAEPILETLAEQTAEMSPATGTPSSASPGSPPSAPGPGPGKISPGRGRPQSTPQPSGSPRSPRQRPGQPLGQDGQWAALYEEAGRNTTARLDALSALRESAGTDLGPIDAGTFVAVVYRGTPQEVRELAGTMLIEQFSRGPNVAGEMLDQFFMAPSVQMTSDTIAQLTGAVLPSTSSPRWPVQARLALVRHVMSLQPIETQRIDDLGDALVQSYIARLRLVSRSALPAAMPDTARQASQRLRESWQHAASMLIASDPTPGELPVLARRHAVRLRLASGPVQQFVANQVAVADLLAYVVTAEKPHVRKHVELLLNEAIDTRRQANHVLNQAIETELSMARLWRLRMGGAVEEDGK